jgi:glycerophosphoryl diester phosphodiesterase
MLKSKLIVPAALVGLAVLACSAVNKSLPVRIKYPAFFKVGHRGTRGLMPENTIPSMIKAIQIGANTVEMDIHITRDGKVMVYHDDDFDPTYTLMPDGSEIPKAERKKYTFYQMDYAAIRPFVIGAKPYPAYPQQKMMRTYAPLLGELIDSVDHYTKVNHLPGVNYLIEIKSGPETDGKNQPAPEEFVDKMMAVLKPKKLGSRLIVQSFDMRPLQVMHKKYPGVALGYLTGDKKVSFEANMTAMGFTPNFYNPYAALVTPELVDKCHKKGMLMCVWTPNTIDEMKQIKAMNVDGIITDYANILEGL